VDIDELQRLELLPEFVGDIADKIRRNIGHAAWRDGWNKKLSLSNGSYDCGSNQAMNIMILDLSSSIPGGVATTMAGLIDTLRTQANADLILTASTSHWIPAGEEIPKGLMERIIGSGNETYEFWNILQHHVAGRKVGNVVVFGDNDSPRNDPMVVTKYKMAGTQVNAIYGYHTYMDRVPGYGRWAEKFLVPGGTKEINTDWVKVMNTRRGQRRY
jgi:hypothetical protein